MADIGPKVLSVGSDPIQVDIVFVHGLGGNRLRTWSQDEIVWPRDLLPGDTRFTRLSRARIISWGYDANPVRFFEHQSHESIFSHAESLLSDISGLIRRTPQERNRPVIFVGHSLGGLVIKQALCKGANWLHTGRNTVEAELCKHVQGLVFMGTPHRGSTQADWADTAVRLAGMLGKSTNNELVASLSVGKPFLDNLQHEFAGFQEYIPIVTALETQSMHKIGKIVEDHSAKLQLRNERIVHIHGDHRSMCKFSNEEEIGYQRMAQALDSLIERIEMEPQAFQSATGLAAALERLGQSHGPPPPARPGLQPDEASHKEEMERTRAIVSPHEWSWEAQNAIKEDWDSDEEMIGLRKTTKSVFATASTTSASLFGAASDTTENLISGVRRLGIGVGSRVGGVAETFGEAIEELFDWD